MVTIVAKSVVKEGKEEAFLALTEELIAESRKEAGCLKYDLYRDLDDPRVFTFIEEWKNREAIEAHNASAHFTRIVPQLAHLREGASEVRLYKKME